MKILESDNDVSINDILLLTFTDNAAENMKERIINSIIKKSNEKESVRYSNINILDAKISTFHSFCNSILKQNPENAPKYLGMEESLSRKYDILENEILERIRFKRIYYNFRKDNLNKYEELFKILTPNEVLSIIKKLLSKGIFPKKEGWFLDGEDKLKGNFEEFMKIANEINTPGQGKRGLTQSKLLKAMKDKLRGKHYLDFPDNCFLDKQVNPKYLEIAFNEDREDLISFIHDIYYEYIRQSVIENKLTFDFLIMFVFLLLYHNHELRKRNSFKYVMIDEFQDTNEMQFMLTLLFMSSQTSLETKRFGDSQNPKDFVEKTNNLCVVGDWKQGIYGFRHATIDNILKFKEKLKEYKTLLNKNYPRINFDVECCNKEFVINFRSSQKILDFAKKALTVKGSKSEEVNIEEITEKIVELKANYKLDEYSDIRFFKAKNGDNGRENEIKMILSKVQEIVNNEDYKIIEFDELGNPKYRNIEYRDVAILSRNRSFCLDLQEKALEIGIPINYDGGVELFKTDEALLLLAWLRLLLNKYDINAWITLLEYENYDYLNKKEILENIKNDILPEKLLNYRNYLLNYQNNIIALISKIYKLYEINTKYSNAIVSEIGKVFNNNPLSIQNLVYFIEENIEKGETYEISINTTDNAVNLQTIHGSKGLEYPVVFVVNCNKGQFPSNNSDKNIIEYNDIYGIRLSKLYGVKNSYHNIFDNWKADLVKSAIVKNNDEERRLMFVAITRAKQYVFFTSHNPSEFFNGLLEEYGNGVEEIEEVKIKPTEQFNESYEEVDLKLPECEKTKIVLAVHDIMKYEPSSEKGKVGKGIEFGKYNHHIAEQIALGKEVKDDIEEVKRIKKFISELNANELLTEIECSLPLGDYIIRGVIDLIAIYNDRVEIIDYKTDVSKNNHSEYVKQLSIYYHAVKEYYNKKTICKIYYVSSDEVVEVEPLDLKFIMGSNC